jgi:hypothetical protein
MSKRATMMITILLMSILVLIILLYIQSDTFGDTACPNCGSTAGYTYTFIDPQHKRVCKNCGETRYITCSFGSWYSNGPTSGHSRTCSVCGGKQTASHSFASWYKYSESYHRRECTVCPGYQSESHNTDVAATCTTAAYCNRCSSYFGNALGHEWPSGWSNNSSQHWQSCTRCSVYLAGPENHYDNDHNGYCDVCSYAMDITPPQNCSVSINSGAVATNTTSVTLTLGATDVSQMSISNTTSQGAWEAYATSKAWTLTAGEDTKTVYVWYRDSIGNTSSYVTDTIIYDITAPTITGHSATQYTNSVTSTVRVNLTGCNDNLSGINHVSWYLYKDGTLQYTRDESYHSGTTWYHDVVLTGQGTYVIHGVMYDNAGNAYNWYAEHGMTIIADGTAPSGSINIQRYTNNPTISVSATASDTGGTTMESVRFATWSDVNGQDDLVWYSVTGTGPNYSTSINLSNHTPGTDGDYNIHVYAYDSVGNNRFLGAQIVTLDRVSPTITINPSSSTACQSKNITVTATDDRSGLSSGNTYQWQLGTSATVAPTGTWNSYTSGATFNIGAGLNGTRYVWIKQVSDNATNVSSGTYTVSGVFVFDNIKPTLTIGNPSVTKARQGNTVTYTITLGEGTTFDNSKVVVSGTATTGASVVVTGSGTTRTATVTVGTGDGTLGIVVNSGAIIDAAGNQSDSVTSVKFEVDNTAPNSTVLIDSGAEQTRGVGVRINVTNVGDPKWVYISNTSSVNLGEITWLEYKPNYFWKLQTKDGQKTVYVWLKDDVGNVTSSPKTDSILLNAIYISSTDETTIKFKTTDSNFHSANIAVGNISIKRGGQLISSAYKNIQSAVSITNGIQYMLDIGGITGNGPVSISVVGATAQDKAGNLSNDNEVATQVIVDNTAPIINITNQVTRLDIECTDASGLVGALLDDSQFITLTEDSGKMIGNINVPGPGTYTIKVMDRAGNVASEITNSAI